MKKAFLFLVFMAFFINHSFAFKRNLSGVKIITRDQRLADEQYLFKDFQAYKDLIERNKEFSERAHKHPELYEKYRKSVEKRKARVKYLEKNRLSDVKSDRRLLYRKNKALRWPISYKKNKTKIVIHHTADNFSKYETVEDVRKYIRWVYYYQAVKRAWGDIWYNFIIDQFWNIYEWRIWWDHAVWAHIVWNNVSSIWISLIWSFDQQEPSQAQFDSLIKLSTAISKKYNIDPYKKYTYHKQSSVYPYMEDVKNFAIIWHKDAWNTSCPWTNLYNLLPSLRVAIYNNLHNNKLETLRISDKLAITDKITIRVEWANFISCRTPFEWFDVKCSSDKLYLSWKQYEKIWIKSIFTKWKDKNYKIDFIPIWMSDIRELLKVKSRKLLENRKTPKKSQKITYKTKKSLISELIKNKVNVLLYELSNFWNYKISCKNKCLVRTDKQEFKNIQKLEVIRGKSLRLLLRDQKLIVNALEIRDMKWETITIDNFYRKSFAWISWNRFLWSLNFRRDYFKPISEKLTNKFVLINSLDFDNYIAWIAESNDQMSFEKSKLMVLLAKTYMLFYMNKKNTHPSIPQEASYNAIDDPRIFQKYVWVWREDTSKTWPRAVNETKNEYLIYRDYIPILPYFSCSKWFTFSALDRFWRTDAPYLKNSLDLDSCSDFAWHWVWLSWRWAEYLARKWLNYRKILQWYYPWVYVFTLDK